MIYFGLLLLGLCLGSFVNALVWRLHMQLDADGNPIVSKKEKAVSSKASDKVADSSLSILNGRSMCPHCKHELSVKDLVPVFSWLSLGGKCRYCKKPISRQYPFVELLTAILFMISFVAWPTSLDSAWAVLGFATWLIALTGLVALAVYDIKWMLLPNRIVFPLMGIVTASVALQFVIGRPLDQLVFVVVNCVLSGGIFWILFQISGGKWIGGGDVKLGFLLGLLLPASATSSFLFLFMASILGLLYSLPLMLTGKLTKTSHVPFGPFLIAGAFVVVLWGEAITNWYITGLLGL